MNWVLLVRLLRPEVSRPFGGATFGQKPSHSVFFQGSFIPRCSDPFKDPQKRVFLSLQETPLFPMGRFWALFIASWFMVRFIPRKPPTLRRIWPPDLYYGKPPKTGFRPGRGAVVFDVFYERGGGPGGGS